MSEPRLDVGDARADDGDVLEAMACEVTGVEVRIAEEDDFEALLE